MKDNINVKKILENHIFLDRKEVKMLSNEDEIKLYHIVCNISKICKNYFYERKYLPKDYWSIDDVVKLISASSTELKKQYNIMKKNSKIESIR